MLDIFKVRRARKAAVSVIAPHVERSRCKLRDIPDTVWFDPYVIGFLGLLITLVAERAVGGLGQQALALVQIDAWREITRAGNADIGEDITLLSTAADASFTAGCSDAEALFAELMPAADAPFDSIDFANADDGSRVAWLWSRCFEERIGTRTGRPPDDSL
jgi:hypothetical protein